MYLRLVLLAGTWYPSSDDCTTCGYFATIPTWTNNGLIILFLLTSGERVVCINDH